MTPRGSHGGTRLSQRRVRGARRGSGRSSARRPTSSNSSRTATSPLSLSPRARAGRPHAGDRPHPRRIAPPRERRRVERPPRRDPLPRHPAHHDRRADQAAAYSPRQQPAGRGRLDARVQPVGLRWGRLVCCWGDAWPVRVDPVHASHRGASVRPTNGSSLAGRSPRSSRPISPVSRR